MRPTRHTVLALFFLIATGCSSEKDSNESQNSNLVTPVTASFLTMNDFLSSKTDTIDKTALAQYINQESEFIANEPHQTSGSGDENEDSCFSRKMNSLKVVATSTSIVIGGQIDYTDCMRELYGESSDFGKEWTIQEISNISKIYMKFENAGCTGDSLSRYNGMSLIEFQKNTDEIKKMTVCDAAGAFYIINNSKDIFKLYAMSKSDANNRVISYRTSRSATMKSDGAPCEHTSDGQTVTWTADCHIVYQTIPEADDNSSILPSYTEIVKKSGLAFNDNGTDIYFTSGVINFNIEGWKGSMTYKGPTTAPSWEAAHGNETATGTYAPPSFVNLQSHRLQQPGPLESR
jgi:hypothetical protein